MSLPACNNTTITHLVVIHDMLHVRLQSELAEAVFHLWNMEQITSD